MKTILLTGGAGFIGSHLAERLLGTGLYQIICIDNLDDFYSPDLKRENLRSLLINPNFTFIEEDISELTAGKMTALLADYDIDQIINLAAKAGVRPSIQDPLGYYRTNVIGLLHLLEYAKNNGIKKFVSASSSSVYGDNPNVPWKETEAQLSPISPYASTKLAGEQVGHVYAHLYGIRFTVVRPFTVFGPRQRPDLAIRKFAELMLQGKEITLFGDGTTRRDYTYVGDIVQGIEKAMHFDDGELFQVFNLGSNRPVTLMEMVETLEDVLGKKAKIQFVEEQPGDVRQTYADISKANALLGYQPQTTFKEGVQRFLEWKLQLPDQKF